MTHTKLLPEERSVEEVLERLLVEERLVEEIIEEVLRFVDVPIVLGDKVCSDLFVDALTLDLGLNVPPSSTPSDGKIV